MGDLSELPGESVSSGFEAARNLTGRGGYDPAFLGGGAVVPLPGLPAGADPAVANAAATGLAKFELKYTHYSVVVNAARRLPFFSAVNIDGNALRTFDRGDGWFLDPRIEKKQQTGDDVYLNNDLDFDRGHMTRRLDPVWGAEAVASLAERDSFAFTNACPQHKELNQRDWARLEDYVLHNAGANDLKVCVLTGPVFAVDDRLYRNIRLPQQFWKVVAIRKGATQKLSVTGYTLSQKEMFDGFEAAFVFGAFKTYQVKVSKIESMTGLDFHGLAASDPLAGGFEAAAIREITGPGSMVF